MFPSGSAFRVSSLLLAVIMATSPLARRSAAPVDHRSCSMQDHCDEAVRLTCCCNDDIPVPATRPDETLRWQQASDPLPLAIVLKDAPRDRLIARTPATSRHWRHSLDLPLLHSAFLI